MLYRHQGKYPQAEALFAKVLEARRRVLGESNPDTLKTMDALAGLYRIQGKYLDAEPMLTKAVEGRRRVLGEQHPDTGVFPGRAGRIGQGFEGRGPGNHYRRKVKQSPGFRVICHGAWSDRHG